MDDVKLSFDASHADISGNCPMVIVMSILLKLLTKAFVEETICCVAEPSIIRHFNLIDVTFLIASSKHV